MVDLVLSKHVYPFDSQMSGGHTLRRNIVNLPDYDPKCWMP